MTSPNHYKHPENVRAFLMQQCNQLRSRANALPKDAANILLDAAKWIENGADDLCEQEHKRAGMN